MNDWLELLKVFGIMACPFLLGLWLGRQMGWTASLDCWRREMALEAKLRRDLLYPLLQKVLRNQASAETTYTEEHDHDSQPGANRHLG